MVEAVKVKPTLLVIAGHVFTDHSAMDFLEL
jgi:hypothetical protein